MEAVAALIILFLLLVLIILPIWTIIRIRSLGDENETLQRRLAYLEGDIKNLGEKLREATAPPAAATPPRTEPAPASASKPATSPAAPSLAPPPIAVAASVAAPPKIAPSPAPAPPPIIVPSPVIMPPPPLPAAEPEPVRRINWEQFMGARLFLWLGGLAAFLGVAFFVKYSFEHDLIPPEVRVALGFLLSAGLIVGGLRISRGKYSAQAQTLCATGIVSLYAVTFACKAVYHFAFFGPTPTFLLMALITAAAFLLAVRLEARVVALLGMLGGFLTPILLTTGVDNPAGLFGYLALLDLGLVAAALHRRWHYLVPLGACCTALMQAGWAGKFFTAAKAPVAVIVCLGFCALFIAAYAAARRLRRRAPPVTWSAVAMPFVSFGFALFFLDYPAIGARPGLLFTFVFLADAGLLALAWLDEELPKLHLVAGLTAFALLSVWTSSHLTDDLLPWALAAYLLFAVLHTAFPLVLQRHRPEATPTWWSQLFPPLALLLMLGPLFKLEAVSLLFWPCILLLDLIAVVLALLSASLTALGVVLVLTLVATGLSLFKAPVTLVALPSLLVVLGGFALFFFAAGIFLSRRLGDKLLGASRSTSPANALFGDARAQIPAFSALLPFVLLILMSQRLPLTDPSPLFGLALLLVVLTLGLASLLTIEWLPACALAGVAALAYAWHSRHFSADAATVALGWYLGFYALFAVYPFAFRRQFAGLTGPWAVAALSGVVHFPLVYRLVKAAWPNAFLGVLPALFAVAPLASLVVILRTVPADHPKRLNQLAWFGGAALFFITLIFPIQFERQWITIGWALEGVALLWLFHRVPHSGLRAVGAVLLVVAFVRLSANPAVFKYHPRADTPIFNWYLYAYGLVTACLFVGARLLAPPRSAGQQRVLGVNAPPLLNGLGAVLAFLLLNIEIADYFSETGRTLIFQFRDNFARDMTYTVAWALFALGLLLAGIWKKARAARYAAIGLLSVTLLKLFFHDLARLSQLYRVAALFAVAVVAIVASFLYQRFVPSDDRSPPPQS